MTKIILPLVEGFAPAFVVLDYIRRQRDADLAILDNALREQAEEILNKIEAKMEANRVHEGMPIFWHYQLEALRASYLGGK
jgi:hypothetical protein